MRRREILVISTAMVAALSVPPILRRMPLDFEFEPVPGFEGFRRLQGGSLSGGVDPFFGLDVTEGPAPLHEEKPLCQALFGADGLRPDTLPVAIFSDFNCPYCKELEQRLIDLRDSGTAIRLIWHEMPLLGPSSERYARAVLAATVLGAGARARQYLMKTTLRPGPSGLRAMADAIDLPAEMLVREAAGLQVERMLQTSLALGRRLGIPGTPGTVIGRTLVIGAINNATLKKLIRLEASEPRRPCY